LGAALEASALVTGVAIVALPSTPAIAQTARELSFEKWPGKGDLGAHAGTQYATVRGRKFACNPGNGMPLRKGYTPEEGNGRQFTRKAGEEPTGNNLRDCWFTDGGGEKAAPRVETPRREVRRAAPPERPSTACPSKCDPSLNGLQPWIRRAIRSQKHER
jgi:hypothetical protein